MPLDQPISTKFQPFCNSCITMPLDKIQESGSSCPGGYTSQNGGLIQHNSAPSLKAEWEPTGDESSGVKRPDPLPQADQKALKEGELISTSPKDNAASFSSPPSLPVIDMSGSQLIGTMDVRDSVAAAHDRRLKGMLVSQGSLDFEGCAFKPQEHYDWEIDPKKLVLKNFVAKGTYGTVHRGSYDGKDVAVKLLDWGEDEAAGRAELTDVRKAFIQEVSVWSTLNHRNVTQFIGAVLGGAQGFRIPSHVTSHDGHILVEGHVSCVVLEYLPGGNLKQLLLAHHYKKLPLKTVIQYALDIARGLAYLHSKHIVHRDVKSDNMLLDRHKVVKIADFGVSRVEDKSCKRLRHVAGTYGYMAPEVLMGIPYDHKVDVYSFGILLWEIYCCDNPFPFVHFNPKDIKSFVNQGLRPQIPSCCPTDLATIMKRCWEKDPDKRPDMGEAVSMLQNVDVQHGRGMVPNDLDIIKPHRGGAGGGGGGGGGGVIKLLHKLKEKLANE